MNSILRPLFLFIILKWQLIYARPVSLENLLSEENIASFPQISDSFIENQSVYLIEQLAGKTKINQYSLNNNILTYQQTYLSYNKINTYWQMSIAQHQIIAFPIQVDATTILINQNIQQLILVREDDVFFRVITGFISEMVLLSTISGNVAYATIQQLQSGQYHLFPNSHHIGNTYISLSPNQLFLCSTDYLTGLVSIWSIQQRMIVVQIWLNQTGIRAHTWSDDSKSLYIIGFTNGTVYFFNNSFILTSTMQTNSQMIVGCFYNLEYNSIIALSFNSSALILIDLDNHNYNNFPLNFSMASSLKIDIKKQHFIVFNSANLSLFRINSACSSIQFYNSIDGICQSCTPNCQSCNQFICFSCSPGYSFDSYNQLCLRLNQQGYNYSQLFGISQSMSQITFSFVNKTLKIAGHRQFLNIFFELFSNFDHLVLYIYHNRTYGPNMQSILQIIHSSIDYRFQLISNDICKEYLGIDFDKMASNIDFKRNYSYSQFLIVQSKGQGFFELNIQYFFLNIPFMIITLFLYRAGFKLVFNHRISILLRKFSLDGVVILLLLEGNVELFFFSFASDLLNVFSSSFKEKIFNFASVLMCLVFILLSTVGLFSLYYFYNKKCKNFYENYCYSYKSAFIFLFFNGALNIVRGFTHRLAMAFPTLQAILLMLIELVECVLIIYCLRRQVFKSHFVAILFILGNLSRMLLDMSLVFDSYFSLQNLDNLHLYIYFFNLATFFIAIIHSFYELAIKIKRIITSNQICCETQSTPNQKISAKANQELNPKIEINNISSSCISDKNYCLFQFKTRQKELEQGQNKEKAKCVTINMRKKQIQSTTQSTTLTLVKFKILGKDRRNN